MQPGLPFEAEPVPATVPTPPRSAVDPVAASRVSFVRHPRARRYVVRVAADGGVRVTIPRGGSEREARRFAESQRAWISRQLERAAADRTGLRREWTPDEVREWLACAYRDLPARLLELASAHGLTVSRVSIRNQRGRWGSCSPSGHICLNWRLVTLPAWVRDYVLLHELMHLKELNHSPRFWALVEAVCPAYREARLWLRAGS